MPTAGLDGYFEDPDLKCFPLVGIGALFRKYCIKDRRNRGRSTHHRPLLKFRTADPLGDPLQTGDVKRLEVAITTNSVCCAALMKPVPRKKYSSASPRVNDGQLTPI
jgi:hypothetical protein